MPDIIKQRDKVYVELLMARKEVNYLQKITAGSLPKKVYNKRKSHKKAAFVAAKTGRERLSKWMQLNLLRMQAEMNLTQKEEAFTEALHNYKLKNKGSIKELVDANRN